MSDKVKALVEQKLNEEFNPTHLDVVDITAEKCDTSFSVIIVSDKFTGKPLLRRHRLVNTCLEEELKSIHAFTMKTYTPEQWEKQQQKQ